MNNKTKLIVILGPTASGKTKMAVDLAAKFNGEIISADSRQVYCGMDVGTGKDLSEYGTVPFHLMDVADPKSQYTLAEFKKAADEAIGEIAIRGKLPMLVGGSGLYLQAVVDNYSLEVDKSADTELRKRLEQKTSEELFTQLQKMNLEFANKLNNSDKNNKRRLIRYLELNNHSTVSPIKRGEAKYDSLIIGLMPDKELMQEKIYKRLIERLEKEDMVAEVERLRSSGVSDQRLKDFGLEYKFIAEYLEEKYRYEEMIERLFIAIKQFAKRQITWFRRWERQGVKIVWLAPLEANKAKTLVKDFLANIGNR